MTAGSSRDWNEFIASLLDRRVRFIIVGAHALAALGRPRYTGDLDVFVEPIRPNIARLRAALADFGAPTSEGIFELAGGDRMLTIGREPVRIDIMTGISGVTFEEAWRGRARHRLGGRLVNFLGRTEYLKNKRASAVNPRRTAKDLADIALLEEVEE